MNNLLQRFVKYIQIDTRSIEDSNDHPSSPGQLQMAGMLVSELQELGLSNVRMSTQGYVMAEIPATSKRQVPTVGFIAHLDTSPEVSGCNVRPRVFEAYDGGDLCINEANDDCIRVDMHPALKDYQGGTIITSDGTTLLGADNKAGIAIIMETVSRITNAPDSEHGKIVIAFTPDEEIGQGADYFDVADFGADFAFTVDGGPLGELEYETFNAALASVEVQGINVHPGYAYQHMRNAIHVAMELDSMLPLDQRPENTRDYQGFYHLNKIEGSVETAKMAYLIRDHDEAAFIKKKEALAACQDILNRKYGESCVTITFKDQYYNMRQKIEPVFHIVDMARRAMAENGVEAVIKPIRGGTDGARLSFMGLPCPNIFTGGHNFHSRHEFICLESMEKAVAVLGSIVRLTCDIEAL